MATEWAITAAGERVTLDDRNHGEITFTVTNLGSTPERAILEPVPGDGADRSWFAVKEPMQLVRAGGSVPYLMTATVPPGTPAGSYWVQGRVFGADSAPEEASRLSDRVALEIKAVAAPKRRPWWPWAVAAALVVVVLAVVGVLVFGGDDPPPGQGGQTMPDVSNRAFAEAEQVLAENGLTVGRVTEVVDTGKENGTVAGQDPGAGVAVREDRTVDLTIVANPRREFPFAVSVRGNGIISGNGIACPTTCTSNLAEGTAVTLTAIPDAGNGFSGWAGQCAGTTGSICRFTMPIAAVTVTATFTAIIVQPPDPNPPVPGVIDLTASQARTVLQAAGFTVNQTSAVDRLCNHLNRVMRQQPSDGVRAARGSVVTITIGDPPDDPCP